MFYGKSHFDHILVVQRVKFFPKNRIILQNFYFKNQEKLHLKMNFLINNISSKEKNCKWVVIMSHLPHLHPISVYNWNVAKAKARPSPLFDWKGNDDIHIPIPFELEDVNKKAMNNIHKFEWNNMIRFCSFFVLLSSVASLLHSGFFLALLFFIFFFTFFSSPFMVMLNLFSFSLIWCSFLYFRLETEM